MKKNLSYKKIATVLGVTMLISIPFSYAELKFEDGELPKAPQQQVVVPQMQQQQQPQVVIVQPAPQQAPVYVMQAPQAQPAPEAKSKKISAIEEDEAPLPSDVEDVQPAPAKKLKKASAGSYRDQRQNAERNNNDRLIEKIEEHRLKYEEKILNKILSNGEEEAPVTDSVKTVAASAAPAPVVESVVTEPVAPKSNVRVTPVAGLTTFTADTYNVESKFSAGVSIGSEIFDNIAVEGEYIFAKYNVSMAQTNPFYASYSNMSNYANPLAFNQNIIDIGMKFFVFNKEARIRPFIGAGLAYIKTYANYDTSSLSYYNTYYSGTTNLDSNNYESNSFAGFLQAGLEFQIAKNFAIGAQGRYFNTFSSKETNVNNYAFMQPGYYGSSAYGASYYSAPLTTGQTQASALGKSLTASNFYQVLASLTISF